MTRHGPSPSEPRCAQKAEARAEGKARVQAAALLLYPIDQQADKALFSPGERYFTSALRFYVGEVSAGGNGWLMHRQSAARLGMLHVRYGLRGFRAPGGPTRGTEHRSPLIL